MKKECNDRKFKSNHLIGCIPNYIVKERISKLLHNQKIKILKRGQKRLTQFVGRKEEMNYKTDIIN